MQREELNQEEEETHYWNEQARKWVEIDHLTAAWPVLNAYTRINELKWGTTLEDAEKSMEYFSLMFPMHGLHSFYIGSHQRQPPS